MTEQFNFQDPFALEHLEFENKYLVLTGAGSFDSLNSNSDDERRLRGDDFERPF